MKRRHILIAFVLALFASAGTAVYAQDRDPTGGRAGMPETMMQEMMEMMGACPMMAAMDRGPEAALAHADQLGLTEQQRQRLEALKQAAQDARDVLTAEQRAKLRELRHRDAMERMAGMMGMMNMMMRMMKMMPDTSEGGPGMRGMNGQR